MRVGVLISAKKRGVLEPRGVFASKPGLEFSMVEKDWDGLDLLLTKISDFEDKELIGKLKKTEIKQFTSCENQMVVADRLETYSRLKGRVKIAETKCIDGNLLFPVILKTRTACGKPSTHLMAVVRNADELKQVKLEGEMIAQRFIEHDDCLYKVFAVGEKFFVSTRPSLTKASTPVGIFDSQKYFKTLDKPTTIATPDDVLALSEIGRAIDDELNLRLFGFDCIREAAGSFVVVDVNYFPSFGEVADFPSLLKDLLLAN